MDMEGDMILEDVGPENAGIILQREKHIQSSLVQVYKGLFITSCLHLSCNIFQGSSYNHMKSHIHDGERDV